MMQISFPFLGTLPERARRCLWRSELLSVVRFLSDERCRDRQDARAHAQRFEQQLSDLRFRLTDVERGLDLADLHKTQPWRKRR